MTGRMARNLALLAGLSPICCDATHIEAVAGPGGPYRSGADCVLDDLQAAGPVACLAGAQLGFEQPGDEALFEVKLGNLSARQVSCRRSYCGTGALKLHADYRWKSGQEPPASEKLGEIRYRLPVPTDLYGRTITYALYLDGPTTPVNAYLAVIDGGGLFHMLHDEPVYLFRRWTQRGAAVLVTTPRINLPPGTTSLPVRELVIAVYLATDVRTGDLERWTADFYVDQVSW
jgi:hypothetical protein